MKSGGQWKNRRERQQSINGEGDLKKKKKKKEEKISDGILVLPLAGCVISVKLLYLSVSKSP